MKHVVDLTTNVPQELAGDFTGKLHYISEHLASFSLEPAGVGLGAARVRFDVRPGREDEVSLISRRINEVAAKMCAGYRGFEPRVLATQRPAEYRFRENPRRRLEADGQLFEFGAGRFGLGPLPVRLLEYFEAGLLQLADAMGATRYQFPALIGADVLQRCRYIQSFPHALTLTAHLREDLEAIQRFARDVKTDENGALRYPSDSVASPKCLLAPAVCFHYYGWLENQRLDAPRTITALGHCFRYESGNMSSLERLWDFTMREIVFVGPEEFIVEQRQRCIQLTTQLLNEWQIGYEIKSATDPFFVEDYSVQSAFQSAFDLKFEIRADLPYAAGKSLAVGSFNYHQDFFGRSLRITGPNGNAAATGCVGFGMERLAWAFLAQHGTDPVQWPERLRSAIFPASFGSVNHP